MDEQGKMLLLTFRAVDNRKETIESYVTGLSLSAALAKIEEYEVWFKRKYGDVGHWVNFNLIAYSEIPTMTESDRGRAGVRLIESLLPWKPLSTAEGLEKNA